MTKEHRAFVVAHEAHNPPGGGCIIYCTGKYEIGNPHSHRWNAGKQAKAEKRVPYNDYNLWKSQKINLEGAIDQVVSMAKKNQDNMRNLVVGGLLSEPYNNNDKPNMIVLPTRRADARKLGLPPEAFTYLTSHGALDQNHMRFFAGLVNGLADAADRAAITQMAKDMFRLYGGVFASIDLEDAHVAA